MIESDKGVDFQYILNCMEAEDRLMAAEDGRPALEPWESPEWLAVCFVEGCGGMFFSAATLVEHIGGDVTLKNCKNLLSKNPQAKLVAGDGDNPVYLSLAPPLEPSPEGLEYVAQLEARVGNERRNYPRSSDWQKKHEVETYY
jgi:hypothetical protein